MSITAICITVPVVFAFVWLVVKNGGLGFIILLLEGIADALCCVW